jgi:hypothetical protein
VVSFDTNKSSSCPENIIIPKYYQGKTVTEIGDGAFKDLSLLKSVELPSSINKIGDRAFYKCTALQKVSMVRCNSLETIPNNCFEGCKKLTTVVLPNSIKTIGNSAFSGCEKLTSFTVSKNVISIGGLAFKDCTMLNNVIFEETEGWTRGNEPLLSFDLADPAIAAERLKEASSASWTRTEN